MKKKKIGDIRSEGAVFGLLLASNGPVFFQGSRVKLYQGKQKAIGLLQGI